MSKLVKLSIAALLAGIPLYAQEAPVATPAEPVAVPVAIPVEPPEESAPAPAPVAAPPPAPVVTLPAPAPIAVPVAEPATPAPVAKPADNAISIVTPGGTKVQIYGRLELNSAYEDGITNGLWSANAKANANKDAQGRTTLSIARTRLGLNLSGPSKEGEPDLTGRFEADFAGASGYSNFNGSSGFRVRQSYGSVKYKDIGLTLLFGMTDDLITPIDPPSINPSSLNGAGNLGNRRPQIRITQALGPVEIAVAATHDRLIVGESDSVPSFPGLQGRLGVKLPATWAGEKANTALGIGYLYAKSEAANDNDKRRNKSPSTYSFNADLSLPVVDILTLTGEFFNGQNLSRYGDGSLGQNRRIPGEDGVKSIGWWGALALKLPANLSAASGIGMESLDDKSTSAGKAESNRFIFANLGYNFTSAAKLTFEYLNLATDYAEIDDKGYLNRYELNFRYDFK